MIIPWTSGKKLRAYAARISYLVPNSCSLTCYATSSVFSIEANCPYVPFLSGLKIHVLH